RAALFILAGWVLADSRRFARIHVARSGDGRTSLHGVVGGDSIEVGNHAVDAVEGVDQVMPSAIVDRIRVAINTEPIGPGCSVKEREGPTTIDASASARPLRPIRGSEGESGAEGRVNSVGKEWEVAALII